MWFPLVYQVALLHYSPLLAFDTRIIIKEERLSSPHWFAHKFAQSISKVAIKKHELPLIFLLKSFGKKRKGEAFQFHSFQNTQVFIALYFSLSTSLREAGLVTSMCAAPIHNAIQPFRCVLQAIPQYHQIALIGVRPVMGLSRKGSVRVQTDSSVLMRSLIQQRFVQTTGPSSKMWQSSGCYSWTCFWIKT